MKQESDKKPINNYEIENIKDGRCDVVLFDLDSIEEVKHTTPESEETISYLYFAYRINLNYNDSLIKMLDKNFKSMLEIAKKESYDKAAAEVREYRNKLLQESDKEMALDRFNFDFPEEITMINIIQVMKGLFNSLKNMKSGAWAEYRQKLRDITTSEGFPFNVEFPNKPEDTKK